MSLRSNLCRATRSRACLPQRVRQCSAPRSSSDYWPDGTPKKFKGRDAWKNWIDWDSPHRELTDELNRARHYFWHVDDRGRLWRKEIDQPDRTFGQMRDARILDFFFSHMQRNTTGLYQDAFPFISFRMHEHYFTSCSDAPVVFNDLRDGELRHICPRVEIARAVSTPFDPRNLRITDEGKLFHSVSTKAVDLPGGEQRREELMALIETSTAQQLLEECEERDVGDSSVDSPRSGIFVRWEGRDVELALLSDGGA